MDDKTAILRSCPKCGKKIEAPLQKEGGWYFLPNALECKHCNNVIKGVCEEFFNQAHGLKA